MNTRKSVMMLRGRKRPRTTALFLLGCSSILHTTNSLSSHLSSTHTRKTLPLPHTDPSHAIQENLLERLESIGYDDEEDDDFVLDGELLEIVQRVQQSTQADVLSTNEQALANVDTAKTFLSQLGGTTAMEQVAMSSITEQLPQASLQAFTENQMDMHYSTQQRVTPAQEQHLGRLIQRGTAVMQVQCDNPKEWALAAGLSGPKELRRTIVDYRRAKHVLVTANMGLVHAVVRDIPGNRQELVQEGSLGLLRAAELFDPTRGLRFSTYAVVWIKGMLSNTHVRELVKVPARERLKWNKIRKAQREWQVEHPDIPCRPEDVAKRIGLSTEEVATAIRRYSQAQNMDSLDARISIQARSGANEGSIERDVAVYDDEGLAERAQLQTDLIAALTSNLDAREARLMRLRYGLSTGRDRTLHECAEAMGLSYSRVQQLNTRCLKKLRKADEVAALQEYLLTIA